MKQVKFTASEEIFTYLKWDVGFANLDQYMQELLYREMERHYAEKKKNK